MSNTNAVMARSSADFDFGQHKVLGPPSNIDPEISDREVAIDDVDYDEQLAIFMASNGDTTTDPTEGRWLRFDPRDADLDGLITGTTEPVVRCWAVA